jgi:multiple sugar transport system permease protein
MTATLAPPEAPAPRPRRRWRGNRWLDWMAVPTVLLLAVVIGYPIVEAVRVSFFDYNLLATPEAAEFVGGENYAKLFDDPVFWESLRNTAIYTVASVVLGMLIGLVLALATENLGGGWRWLRGLLLTPWAVPVIVVSFLFRLMLDEKGGIVNSLLVDVGLIDEPVRWLTSDSWALVSVTFANIWSTAPFFLLVFTAALGSVPTEVLEAARIDKAGFWATIVRIKLPFLRSAALVGALIMTIQNFNNFPLIWSMTEGGPAYSTTTLVIYVYRLAFTSYDLGYASAIGVVWLVLLLALSVLFVRTMRGSR